MNCETVKADYQNFIARKSQSESRNGFKPSWIPDFLFDFQKALVEWGVEMGRCAKFAECGLGKTPMELVWAENVVRKTNRPVLILTPLAVGAQFIREGEKFGVECEQSKDGKFSKKIVISNYERLHYFDHADFSATVCDEASILKNYDGQTKAAVTEFMRQTPYRLLATATPAPNDYIELGTSSEALGHLGHIEMLQTFFKADNDSFAQGGGGTARRFDKNPFGGKFRFRGHAERDFWRWVCSWARAIRKPSDLGFNDGNFILPPLKTTQYIVESKTLPEGFMFAVPATNLFEQRAEQRRTLVERCERAAELINKRDGSVAWCNLNDEGDLLEKLIVDCVQVAGSDSIEFKEEAIDAFQRGQVRRLVTKGDCAGFGLNFQHCNHQTFFPSHSFEMWHQCVRRSWRFGQKNEVQIDMVTTEGQSRMLANLLRKEAAAEAMFDHLVELMNDQLSIKRKTHSRTEITLPTFLK